MIKRQNYSSIFAIDFRMKIQKSCIFFNKIQDNVGHILIN